MLPNNNNLIQSDGNTASAGCLTPEFFRSGLSFALSGSLLILLLIFFSGPLAAQTGFRGDPGRNTVRPGIIDDVLYNPGMGFTTMSAFDGDVEGHPRSTVAYWRFYWDRIEPEDGLYQWDIIDTIIETATLRGQKVGLGIMPANGSAPQWYRDLGVKGFDYTPESGGRSWMPDHNDPLYLEYMGRLVKEMGERYDGHPGIDHVDIRSVGHWGEWHFGFINPRPQVKPEIRRALVDIYLDNFRETPLIMLIGGGSELTYAIENGAGWRADCLGDLGFFSPTWNHMKHSYQQALDAAGAGDAWKRAPVHLESCWVMQNWANEGYDVEHILNEALRWNVSVLNNKSSPVPPRWQRATDEFKKRMGYRIVINYLTIPSKVKAGEKLQIESEWENLGVAPVYRNYLITFKLIPQTRIPKGIYISDPAYNSDLREWLPGKHKLNLNPDIPSEIKPGKYNLAVALIDPSSGEVAIQLAIEGRDSNGWYVLSEIEVE